MFPSLYRVWKQSAQDSTSNSEVRGARTLKVLLKGVPRKHKIEDLGCRFNLCIVLALVTNNFLFECVPQYEMREMVMTLVSMA